MEFDKYLEKARNNDLRSTAERERDRIADLQAEEARRRNEIEQLHQSLLPKWLEVADEIADLSPPYDDRFLPGEKFYEYNTIQSKGHTAGNYPGTTNRRAKRTAKKLADFYDRHSLRAWDLCSPITVVQEDSELGVLKYGCPGFLAEDGRIFIAHGEMHPGVTPNQRFPLKLNYDEVAQGLANLCVKFNL